MSDWNPPPRPSGDLVFISINNGRAAILFTEKKNIILVEGEGEEGTLMKEEKAVVTRVCSQPPTVACKMEAQLECMHNLHTFLHAWRLVYMLSRCLSTKNFCIGAQEEVY